LTDGHSRSDWFRPEGREERTENIAVLKRSERRDVKFWNSSRKNVNSFAPGYTKSLKDIGKSVTQIPQISESVVASFSTFAKPSNGDVV
jgi:hypothetical protein